MKKGGLLFSELLTFVVCLILSSRVMAQAIYPVRVQVNVVQPVPPYLPQIKADVAGNRSGALNQDISSHLSVVLAYTGRSVQRIKLAGSIERVAPSPMGVSLRPDFQPAQPIILGPAQPMLGLTKDMLQNAFGNFTENSLVYNNLDLDVLRQNGVDFKLPEGTYRICVTAYDYDKGGFSAPLSAPGTGCSYFTICYTASAPQLILPVSTMLQSNSQFQNFTPHTSQIQFSWTPPVTTCGLPLGALTYNLEIRRVFDGQTVTDAVNNPYVFRQQNIPTTNFLLDTLRYAHVLVPGDKYIVRVKANFIAMPGSPLEIANQGYSQIGALSYQQGSPFPGNPVVVNPPVTPVPSPTPPPATAFKPGSACPVSASITNTTDLASDITGLDLTIGSFKMHIDQASKNTDGSYKGGGYIIWHPFVNDLRLKVTFDGLRVNTDKVVYTGAAYTSTDGSHPLWAPFSAADPVAQLTGLDNSNYEAIATRISDGAHLVNQAAGNDEIDFPLGLNTTIGAASVTLAIMGISFTPACTNMNVLLDVNCPDLGGWLSLGGTGLQIDPNKILLDKGGVLYLPQDHVLPMGSLHFTFDGCPAAGSGAVDTSKGTYVQWNGTTGLEKIVVNADLQFTNTKSIVAVDKNDQRLSDPASVHARFSFSDWNDWMASITLPNDLELAGLPGFPIHSDGFYYDHSNTQNPAGINFPDNYTGVKDLSFQGLYAHSLLMDLPANFKKFSGAAAGSFGFTDLILDNGGVTAHITGTGLLDISTGSLGGWAFSIDKIDIGIVQDNFQNGMQMNGQLKLPISTTSLAYTCNLNSGGGTVNYQFVVHPSGELDVPLWVAKISLDANSSLVINNDMNGMAVKTHLNGGIGVQIAVSGMPKLTLPGLSFQDMAMANRKDTTANAAAGFYFDPGKWSFGGLDLSKVAKLEQGALPAGGEMLAGGPYAGDEIERYATGRTDGGSSDGFGDGRGQRSNNYIGDRHNVDDDGENGDGQGTVAGFGINLSGFAPYFSVNSLQQFEAGVYFDLNVNVGFGDASVVSGSTRLGILGQINIPGSKAPFVTFDKLDLKQVKLHGGIGPVTVDGELDFLNNDPVFGDGIKGSLSADFPFASFTAAAQFGTTQGSGGFHYWAIGGSVFLEAGVPIGPGLTVNGFGGGVYHNMTLSVPADADIRSHPSTAPGTIPMVPQNNTTGIQAQLIVAVIQPVVCNASLTLSAEIHNGGLGLMQLNGAGYIITDPPDNKDAVVSATMVMKYDFENKIFDTYIDAQFHFLVAYANAPIWMHGGPDGDYLYIGRPDQGDDKRISLTLISIGSPGDVLYVDLGATAYFDAGTVLPGFPPLPSYISSHLDKGSSDNSTGSILQMLGKTGNAGFMFGAEVHGHVRLDLLFLYAQVDAALGFDLAMMKVANPPAGCLQSDGSFGLNHWYALGQMYAYFNLDIGLHVDLWFYSGDVSLCKEEAWAVLEAGLPNPSWVDGEVHVEGSALGGLVSVSGDFPFSFGSECNVNINPLDNIQMITDVGPKDSAGVFDLPYAAFSIPIDGRDYPITVPPDDKHSQAYTRTFRFNQYQFNLYKEKSDGDSLVAGIGNSGQLNTSSDGLGSTLYHSSMLQSRTKYKIYIQCYVHEVVNGQSQDPVEGPKWQDTTCYFTTGPAPTYIVPENIAYTYPISGQRYLLQNEFGRRGQIKLGQWQGDILPAPSGKLTIGGGYDYTIKFIPASGGDTLTTNFTLNQVNNSLDFQLPAGFKNNMIYDLQVWVQPKGKPMTDLSVVKQSVTQTDQSQRNVQTVNSQGQTVQKKVANNASVTLNKNIVKLAPQGNMLGSKPIFTLRFQTSQYNSFADKMAAYGQWSTRAEDGVKDISIYSQNTGAEKFDEFDIKGYASACKYCSAGSPSTYPPLFSAVVPWDNNSQNDKFASDNLYANSFILVVSGLTVDLGAPEVRDLMRPIHTLYTDGMPYDTKLPALGISLSQSMTATISNNALSTGMTTLSGKSGSGGSASSGNPSFYSAGALFVLPASYKTTGGQGQQTSKQNGQTQQGQLPQAMYTAQTELKPGNVVLDGPSLVWKHDHYIYADYQLLQQFANNFLANQQNKIWMWGLGTIPQSLALALGYGTDVSLGVGEYGSISVSTDKYSTKWNDPTLTNLALSLQKLSWQPFPATAGRALQFGYTYPFCSGCAGSTVPEKFNYGSVILLPPSATKKINAPLNNMKYQSH